MTVVIRYPQGEMKINADRILEMPIASFRKVMKLMRKHSYMNDCTRIKRILSESLEARLEELKGEWCEWERDWERRMDQAVDKKHVDKLNKERAAKVRSIDYRTEKIMKCREEIEND